MTGEELKTLRKLLGLSQTEMGEKIGLSASAVAHLESGKNNITRQTEMLAKMLCDKP